MFLQTKALRRAFFLKRHLANGMTSTPGMLCESGRPPGMYKSRVKMAQHVEKPNILVTRRAGIFKVLLFDASRRILPSFAELQVA